MFNISQANPLTLLVINTSVAIALFDRDMKYLAVSQRWLDDYQLDNTVLGKSHYQVFPEIPDEWKKVHRRVLNGEIVSADEDRFERSNGLVHWLRWEVCPWYQAGGEIGGIFILTEDITERKHAEELIKKNSQFRQTILDSILDPIVVIDKLGKIIAFNKAWASNADKITNKSNTIDIGKNYLAFYEQKSGGNEAEFALANGIRSVLLEQQNEFKYEYSFRNKFGEKRWFIIRVSHCIDKESILAVITHTDITDRKLAEENRQIEHEINIQKLKLEELNRHYIARQTATAIAHELNQPLCAISNYIRGGLELLRAGNIDYETLCYVLENSEKQAQRASQSIHELVALLHKDDTPAEVFDIEAIIARVLDMMRTNDSANSIRVLKQTEPYLPLISGNPLHVQKVLLNLLNNAVRAIQDINLSVGVIVLSTSITANNDSMLRITVTDNGKGLTEQDMQSMFQPFYSTKKSGLGMGLSVSKALVEHYGGTLWAEPNAEGIGASFHFTLPIA